MSLSFRMQRFGFAEALALFCIAIIVLPLCGVFVNLFQPWSDTWRHLLHYVLLDYVLMTLGLMLGVAALTIIMGVGLAWATTMLDFPGRRAMEFLLLLPLAIPTYVLAFVYRNLFDALGWGIDLSLPPLISVILIQSLSFYIYVYLFVRASFLEQSVCILEAGRVMGCSAAACFFRLALPLSRLGVAAGVALALMECLNDFGSMSLYGLPTLTTGIYRIWNSLGEVTTAAQLASLMVGFVLLLLALERYARSQSLFSGTTNRRRNLPRYRLSAPLAIPAMILCGLTVLATAVVPIGMLIYWVWSADYTDYAARLAAPLQNSMAIAGIAVIALLTIGLILSYTQRWRGSPLLQFFIRFCGVGYALPGVVLALSLFIGLNAIENYLPLPDRFLTAGWLALLLAYCIRFMNFSLSSIEVGFGKISHSIDEAARMAGAGMWTAFSNIHFKLLGGSLFAGAILIFVEVIKELPATLLLRPFDFNTLAVDAYFLASDERIEQAALPALAMVVCGLIAVGVFYFLLHSGRNRGNMAP